MSTRRVTEYYDDETGEPIELQYAMWYTVVREVISPFAISRPTGQAEYAMLHRVYVLPL